MTKLGYFDAKTNKPGSPNYKIENFDSLAKQSFGCAILG